MRQDKHQHKNSVEKDSEACQPIHSTIIEHLLFMKHSLHTRDTMM